MNDAALIEELKAVVPPDPEGARQRAVSALVADRRRAPESTRSRWRWALGGLAAVVIALSPPGQAVAERLGELVGIGEESSVTEPNLRDPRLTGQQDRVGPAIVVATGTVPGTDVPFEIVGWAARAKSSRLSGAAPGVLQTCLGTVWPTIGEQYTGKWCWGEDGSESVPYPFHTFGVGGSTVENYGPNAPYEFIGVTRPEVARMELTYRDADGNLQQGPVTLGTLDGKLLEETGGNRPFGFFEAFVPYDGLPRNAFGYTGSPAAESAVLTAYDADGKVLGTDEVGETLRRSRESTSDVRAAIEARNDAAAATEEDATVEEVVIGGVTVYRTERDVGAALYALHPPGDDEADRANVPPGDSYSYMTTGDVDGCQLLAQRPGNLVEGCAIVLAMKRFGDLDAKPGPAETVYTVCGRDPGPGEVRACDGQVVTEAEATAAQKRMRAALAESG